MNSLDTRIQQALRAQAEQLTERQLTPMLPPSGHQPRSGWSLPILAAAAVALLVAGGTIAVRAATGPAHRGPAAGPTGTVAPTPTTPVPTPTSTAPTPTGTAPTPTGTVAPTPTSSGPLPTPTPSGNQGIGLPAGYEPLWPIDASGHGEPAGNAPATALAFTRQYLSLTEITTVTSSRYDGQNAHIGVGYRNPAGQLATAAVLHLIRLGTANAGIWEVVGSDDTTFTLEQPAYGSSVSSPMTVGGHITGVDEYIRVIVRSQAYGTQGTGVGVPAGGQAVPWHTTVPFTGGGVWTVVALTGGHVQSVERFAIQGVHA